MLQSTRLPPDGSSVSIGRQGAHFLPSPSGKGPNLLAYLWEAPPQIRGALWIEEGPWQETLAAWAQARLGRLIAVGGERALREELVPGAARVEDLEGLARHAEVEVVHLMAPPARVAALVPRLLQAGKHILLGSPPPAEPAVLEELIHRAAGGDPVLAPIGPLAPPPGLRRLFDAAGRGMVGRVRLLDVRVEADPWQPAGRHGAVPWGVRLDPGGVLLRLGPPIFSQLPGLLGVPLAVTAVTAGLHRSPGHLGAEDLAWVQVRCTQGWCSARFTWVENPRSSADLLGAAGHLHLDETAALSLHTPGLVPGEEAEVRIPYRPRALGAELDRALEMVWRRDRRVLGELAAGLWVTEAAYRSAAAGAMVEVYPGEVDGYGPAVNTGRPSRR